MKKIALLATGFLFSFAAMAQTQAQTTGPKADDVIKMNEEKHDFGKLKQGVPVTYYFEIKNISNKPVIIETASASCGCTVPEKPEKPIMPGETGKLKVQYNAASPAPFVKDVYIKLAGVDQQKVVQIAGEVLTAEAYETWIKSKKG
jgi:hypothetical protein